MRAKFAEIGGEPLAGSRCEFGHLIAEETEKRGKKRTSPPAAAHVER
jgi:hypothetical protein